MQLPTWSELSKRGIDVTVDDIIHVLTVGRPPNDMEKVMASFDGLRLYFKTELEKSKNLSKAEAFALGKPYNDPLKPIDSQVDFYVMTKKGILHVDEDGNQNISPKWEKVVKIAAILKNGTKKEKKYVEEKLIEMNRSTPFSII